MARRVPLIEAVALTAEVRQQVYSGEVAVIRRLPSQLRLCARFEELLAEAGVEQCEEARQVLYGGPAGRARLFFN